MYFLYPNVLWFLFLLSIPIVIHFFNIRRYKKIYFSNIQLLKHISEKSQVKNKIKEYLILLCRLLALACLVFAFAQPIKKSKRFINFESNNIIIYIDNSFSMENVGKGDVLINEAIQKSKEIIKSFPKSSHFYILTNDYMPTTNTDLTFEEGLQFVSKIKISGLSEPHSFSDIINKVKTLNLKKPLLFYLSDGQKKFTDINVAPKDSSVNTFYFLLTPSKFQNISIDSVWSENPVMLKNTNQTLHVKLTNHYNESIQDIPVKLIIQNRQIAITNVSIPTHQSYEATVSFMPKSVGFNFGKLMIEDYPITFDNQLFFAFNTNIHINATLINGIDNPQSSKYIRTFFHNDSMYNFSEQTEGSILFNDLKNQDMIVLNEVKEYTTGLTEQIHQLLAQGKSIIIIPYIKDNHALYPSDLNTLQWTYDTTKQSISGDILKHHLFKDVIDKFDHTVKMPSVKGYFFTHSNALMEPLIYLNNNKPLLFAFHINGFKNFFVFTSSLNDQQNSLAISGLFVPLMYQLSFLSINNTSLYYYTGQTQNISVHNVTFSSDRAPKIISADTGQTNFQLIPAFKSDKWNQSVISINNSVLLNPGNYFLQVDSKNILPLSFNYNRQESDMQFYSVAEIEDIVKQTGASIISVNDNFNVPMSKIIHSEIIGTNYWKLCLILALIFLTLESLIIRFFDILKLRKQNKESIQTK